jgi:predicted type IV restriction endonuclease
LIEAKSSDRNLDDYLSQLKRYCDELGPILAIITNGEDIRFYSPFWRRSNFNERLIYSITRQDLSDDDTIEKIERVLGKQFLEDGSIVEHTEEREREISSIKKEIQSLESSYQDKIASIDNDVKSLEEQDKSIQLQIEQKKTSSPIWTARELRRPKNLKRKISFILLNPDQTLRRYRLNKISSATRDLWEEKAMSSLLTTLYLLFNSLRKV